MQLRPYQQALIDDTRKSVQAGHRSVVSVLGCGGGKSIIQGQVAKNATDKGNRVLYIIHRRELLQQIEHTFRDVVGVDMTRCDVCMVQTISRRLDRYAPDYYQLIITDEAHHSTAGTYIKVFKHFPDAVRLGFTATPIRLNRGGLGDVYSSLITSVSTKWLIDHHYLAPYHYYSVPLADASTLHTKRGDFDQAEVASLMENGTIYGDTVKQWKRFAEGKKTIVYCASVEAAEKTADEFFKAGYPSMPLSGKSNSAHRAEVMRRFRSGEITVLTNCELFGEGLDVPDCECVVLLRPTQSLTLFIQQSMRSMRYLPGKTAIILDHVGNCYRHGLPDDEREWSLEPKKVQQNTVKIRECPNCYAVYPPTLDKCPYCGFEAVHEVRTVNRKTVDVDLVEVRRQDSIRNTPLKDANLKTWDEVVEFQRLHKYKFPWCFHYCENHDIEVPKKYRYSRKYAGGRSGDRA